MLTKNRAMSRFLTSQALTAAIVGGVVLINSVAWGIPLLMGSGQSASAVVGTNISTGSLPRLRGDQPSVLKQAVLRAPKALMPLPQQAPNRSRPVSKAERGAQLPPLPMARLLPTRPLPVRQPKTLFPRPVAPPGHLSADQLAKSSASATEPRRAVLRKPVRDVVLVSPYTPGVRIAPNGRGHQWRHRNLHVSSGATTLDRAREIARRASLRFEQMRHQLAGLDGRGVVASNDVHIQRRALLPVAVRPPRIVVDGAARHSVARSAYSEVRTRLIRRPLNRAATPRQDVAAVPTAPPPGTIQSRLLLQEERAPSAPGVVEVPPPARIARLSPQAAKRSPRRARVRRARVRRGGVRAQRRPARSRRANKFRKARHRRSSRKINGFHREFHRQLVAVNFFGGSR